MGSVLWVLRRERECIFSPYTPTEKDCLMGGSELYVCLNA